MTAPRPSTARRSGRREVLGLGALSLGSLLLAACSTGAKDGSSGSTGGSSGSDGGASADFPRTIEHVYGSTTIEKQPTRVATVSWVNHDVALALGVVPIGMPETSFGGNAGKSTDWFDAALEKAGQTMPTMYAETDGPNLTEIAALQPDLILAVYSGITQEQYDQLAKIAPTIAYPKGAVAYGTPWQDSLTMIGKALGRDEQAAQVSEDVERAISDYAAENPTLKGATFLYGTIDPTAEAQVSLYTDVDNRPRFLEQLGMVQAPVVTENATDDKSFFLTWTPERADELQSDIFVSWAADASLAETIAADPLLSRIPAVQSGTLVLQTDAQQVLSISAASPLSLPWALESVVPAITEATKKVSGR